MVNEDQPVIQFARTSRYKYILQVFRQKQSGLNVANKRDYPYEWCSGGRVPKS